ncbi:hypothetical protein, partial [Pseudomonas fragi]|uniref:hypothetical protein n=1 Tax=Pseudomonas fragi TaxID=296 RepID=UPI0028E1941C
AFSPIRTIMEHLHADLSAKSPPSLYFFRTSPMRLCACEPLCAACTLPSLRPRIGSAAMNLHNQKLLYKNKNS